MWWLSFVILFLFFAVSISYYKRYRQFDAYLLILVVYSCVSACCVLYAFSDRNHYPKLSVGGFVYLFLIVMMCIQPYRGITLKTSLFIPETKTLKILFYIYLFSGVVSVYYTLPRAIELSQAGDWASVRADVYNGFDGIELYTNQFERLCKNLYSYIAPFGIVWTFYQFIKEKYNKVITYFSLLIWSLSTYSSASLIASRGMVLTFAVKMISLYVIFRPAIPQKRRMIFYIIGGVMAAFFLSYSLAVTDSRFGDDSNDSLFLYFGHSMLAFNSGVFNSMTDFAYGKYFFKWIFDALGTDSYINFARLGSTHGTAFVTFVGCFFFDFGIIGTFIFALIFNKLLKNSTKNLNMMSDIIVFIYFASWFLDGVFVFGRSQSLSWLMLFVLRFILKRIERKPV